MSPEATPWRRAPWFATIWLFFLIDPLLEAWRLRSEVRGVVGILVLVVFAVVYLGGWISTRRLRTQALAGPSTRWSIGYVAALAVLGAVVVAAVGEPGMTCVVYLGVAVVVTTTIRVAAALVLGLALATVAIGAAAGWGSQVSLVFSLVAASIAVGGVRSLMNRTSQLVGAQQEIAELAVENERTRFARDLHDILGHSLTVITVKAELAGRLLDVDVERTRAEIADLERLSRDALADVRRAVEGYREISLPGELARARTALAAAQITADLPNSTDDVPTQLREVFAWTVREGVTNVLRHSRAGHCQVLLTPTSAEVRDDGIGCRTGPTGAGSGLHGLRDRASEAGAVLLTRDLGPGWSVSVVCDRAGARR